jgi:hypothetical protein
MESPKRKIDSSGSRIIELAGDGSDIAGMFAVSDLVSKGRNGRAEPHKLMNVEGFKCC